MTGSGSGPINSADDNSRVGVQAQTIDGGVTIVHGDMSYYDTPPGASPEEKYQVGRNNLAGRMATRARELIWDAMTHDYQNSQVLFHWLVAMLSGRTIRQFSDEELDQLKHASSWRSDAWEDPWAEGVRLIFRLLESVGTLPKSPRPSISIVVKEFEDLGAEQRDMLLPHLELFLDDHLKDDMWQRELEKADAERLSGGRRGRAWMFFQPDPIPPRVTKPQPLSTTSADWIRVWASAGIFAAAVAYFGWELMWHGLVLGALAYVAGIAGGAVAAVKGRELGFLTDRRRLKDEQLRGPEPSESRPPRDGFTDQVDALFRHYSTKYLPKAERIAWEAATAGIRKLDRDEIVTEYREARIPANRTAWLIRYRIRQSIRRWEEGKLLDYLDRLCPSPNTTVLCWAGIAIAFLGGIGAIATLRTHPRADAASVIFGLLSGIWAWRNWLRVDLARRHCEADAEEYVQRRSASKGEFKRWSRVLERRPSDAEMAVWLDCDRIVLLGQAMDHYKLARSQVIAYAFLEEPGIVARRARAHNGPMRYSRYRLVVFLLTADGVRQLTADLNFLAITLRHLERISYRYDAVVSAYVSLAAPGPQGRRIQQRFTLTLVNGDPISVVVTDLDPQYFQQGEDADSLSRATLDAASVTNTLHVLEGIAAEGKRWFQKRNTGQGPGS